jgi:hypothetical protein
MRTKKRSQHQTYHYSKPGKIEPGNSHRDGGTDYYRTHADDESFGSKSSFNKGAGQTIQ